MKRKYKLQVSEKIVPKEEMNEMNLSCHNNKNTSDLYPFFCTVGAAK
jgi:hypothetical protein